MPAGQRDTLVVDATGQALVQRFGLRDQGFGFVEVPTQLQRVGEQRHRNAHAHRFFDVERALVGEHLAQNDRAIARTVFARQRVAVEAFDDGEHRVGAHRAVRRVGRREGGLDRCERLTRATEMRKRIRERSARVERGFTGRSEA